MKTISEGVFVAKAPRKESASLRARSVPLCCTFFTSVSLDREEGRVTCQQAVALVAPLLAWRLLTRGARRIAYAAVLEQLLVALLCCLVGVLAMLAVPPLLPPPVGRPPSLSAGALDDNMRLTRGVNDACQANPAMFASYVYDEPAVRNVLGRRVLSKACDVEVFGDDGDFGNGRTRK